MDKTITMILGGGLLLVFLIWVFFGDVPRLDTPGGILYEKTTMEKMRSCQTNDECVYALNIEPILKCVSGNCPPLEEAQPKQGNPAYEWMEGTIEGCVNFQTWEKLNKEKGETLQIDTRTTSCACIKNECTMESKE
ncbi:MAG: hypothetical protein V1776_04765 [Candidatus Diapherotrites archaeon]